MQKKLPTWKLKNPPGNVLTQRNRKKVDSGVTKSLCNAFIGITFQLQPTKRVKRVGKMSPCHWLTRQSWHSPTNPIALPSLTQASVRIVRIPSIVYVRLLSCEEVLLFTLSLENHPFYNLYELKSGTRSSRFSNNFLNILVGCLVQKRKYFFFKSEKLVTVQFKTWPKVSSKRKMIPIIVLTRV